MRVKALQLLLNEALPEEARDYNRVWDSKAVGDAAAVVARTNPKAYADYVKLLGDTGRRAAYLNGTTIGLDDLRPVFNKDPLIAQMDKEVAAANKIPDEKERTREKNKIMGKYSDTIEKLTVDGAALNGNSLGKMVASGARGKKDHLKMLLSTPALYTDYKGEIIPTFIRHSLAEGMRPGEYLAGTYGARSSVISTKVSTADGGDLLKVMNYTAANQVITEDDCGTDNGIDLKPDDSSLPGRVLAKPIAGLPAGTMLDRVSIARIKKSGAPTVLVRSPLTCASKNGLCAKCYGRAASGGLPKIGDAVGITSASALGEPVAQQALSSKHCLEESTLVMMADLTRKPIRDLEAGEAIYAADLHGQLSPQPIAARVDRGIQTVAEYTYRRIVGEQMELARFTCTEDHVCLFYDPAFKVFVPMPLRRKRSRHQLVVIRKGKPEFFEEHEIGPNRDAQCYDLELERAPNLFVLACGAVVHNTGGAYSGKKEYAGFDVIDRFVQAPETFPDKAAVAQQAGKVTRIEPAPQGGTHIWVGDEQHYVQPGFAPVVKLGDQMEAGDALSEGLVDPKEIVNLRGLGEGRRYYAERLKKIFDDSGVRTDQKHTEVLARAALDNLAMDSPPEESGWLPDDNVSYNKLQSEYVPPPTAKLLPVSKSLAGRYLQAPALHYSIGTKLTPRMLSRLEGAGYKHLPVDENPPPFTPNFIRLRTASHEGEDWLANQYTSYLKANLKDDAVRGRDTNVEENTHFAPRLAIGEGFGKNVGTTGKF